MKTLEFTNLYRSKNKAISVSKFGCGVAASDFCQGPYIRNEYVIHYITDGICYYEVGGNKYTIHPGDAFIILPNQIIKYYTDRNALMTGYWIDFIGNACAEYMNEIGISDDNLVIHNVSGGFGDAICKLLEHTKKSKISQLYMEACLLESLSYIDMASEKIDKLSQNQKLVKKAIAYMEDTYFEKISISDISSHIGIERSYFYRIFKSETGKSPSEYLTELRLKKAETMLKLGASVKVAAASVGIDDVYYFSRLFSNKKSINPSTLKNKNVENSRS